MWDWLTELNRHLAFVQVASVAEAKPGATQQAGDTCSAPGFDYGEWEQTGEERWYDGTRVMQRIHYRRMKTDRCSGETTSETKTDGPVRLWEAVPKRRLSDVNRPAPSDSDVSGSPLRSTNPDEHVGRPGPSVEVHVPSGGSEAASGRGGNNPPAPFSWPVLALLLGVVVAYARGNWLPGFAAGDGDSSRTGRPRPDVPDLSWGERARAWYARQWKGFVDRWDSARAWVKYTATDRLIYVAKSAGLYAAGFAYEISAGGVFLGIPHLALGLAGRHPDGIDDYWFQTGRKGGGTALMVWGLFEILLGITGTGAGLLASATGVGAIVGVPAIAFSGGLVAAGGFHVSRGFISYRQADEAAARTAGRSAAQRPKELLTKEQVKQLLGPNASDEAVARFMKFQDYAAERLGRNWSKARVQALMDKHGDLAPMLKNWIEEIGPERTAEIFAKYSGRRQVLGAITEHRLAAKLAQEKDIVWMKVVSHTNHRGADIYFAERVVEGGKPVLKTGIADAKGSLSGMTVTSSSAFSDVRAGWTIDQLKNEIYTAYLKGTLPDEMYKELQAAAVYPDIYIGLGGSAGMTDDAVKAMQKLLRDQRIKANVVPIELDLIAVPVDP